MKSGKKLLSLILALCMVLSVIGVAAFAADTESSEPVGDQPVALSVPNAQDLKGLVEKYFGSTQAFANFVADTVGRIVTGTKSDHLAEVIVNAFENGIIIGNISQMTDEEVKVMLDQIYWVYADNPGPITQTVDCIKMFVNWCDASIHRGQDGLLLGTMQKKLATYYWNWLKENCSPDWWDPNRPTDPSEPTVEPTKPTDPSEEPTKPTDRARSRQSRPIRARSRRSRLTRARSRQNRQSLPQCQAGRQSPPQSRAKSLLLESHWPLLRLCWFPLPLRPQCF